MTHNPQQSEGYARPRYWTALVHGHWAIADHHDHPPRWRRVRWYSPRDLWRFQKDRRWAYRMFGSHKEISS